MFNRLYVHVPFCIAKCHYCAFISRTPQKNEIDEYPALLLRELQLYPHDIPPLASIYFGGGTPSLLKPKQLAILLAGIDALATIQADAEITLEVNPGTVDKKSLKEFRDAGINRISLGIQSFDDRFLDRLGRIHSVQQSRQAFRDIRELGFNNVSIDLIHSLPGQNLDQWRAELQHAITLNPEHISIYGLTVEEGTPFAQFSVAFDSKGETPKLYGVKGMPTSFLVGRDGKIISQHLGFKASDRDLLEKQIQSALEGKK